MCNVKRFVKSVWCYLTIVYDMVRVRIGVWILGDHEDRVPYTLVVSTLNGVVICATFEHLENMAALEGGKINLLSLIPVLDGDNIPLTIVVREGET